MGHEAKGVGHEAEGVGHEAEGVGWGYCMALHSLVIVLHTSVNTSSIGVV